MAAIDFPNSPSVNDQFTAAGKTWVWTGTSWDAVEASAGSTPGGSDTEIQFNDGGSALGGDAGFTYNKTTNAVTLFDPTLAKQVQITLDSNGNILFDAGTNQNFHFSGDVIAFSNLTPPVSTWWDSMPYATASTVGGIKVGSGLSITSGVLSISSGQGGHTIWNDTGTAQAQETVLQFKRLTVTAETGKTVVTRPSDTYVAVSPPTSPFAGDTWISSETLKGYVYYDSFWVEDGSVALNGVTQAYVDAKFATRYARRSDVTGGYAYCGVATFGSAESAASWYVTRIPLNADGTTGTVQRSATNSIWNNRTSLTYT